jgi:hypothetical protein
MLGCTRSCRKDCRKTLWDERWIMNKESIAARACTILRTSPDLRDVNSAAHIKQHTDKQVN